MGTVIEADDVGELFAACEAAHCAVEADRVSTVLKIDDKRTTDTGGREGGGCRTSAGTGGEARPGVTGNPYK